MKIGKWALTAVLACCAAGTSSVSHAQESSESLEAFWSKLENMPREELYAYGQEHCQIHDVVGDFVLQKRTYNLIAPLFRVLSGAQQMADENAASVDEQFEGDPEGLRKFLAGEDVEPAKPGELYIDGRENPIRREGFVQMLTEVIAEERANGIEPVYGDVHDWGPEIVEHIGENDAVLRWRKVLLALAAGTTYRFMKTDQEQSLTKYILSRPDSSITLDEIFRTSYRLNRGNVYLTIMTIENVLAKNWRDPRRERLPITKKLNAFTSRYGKEPDRYGTWYHFFGIMLYGYVADDLAAASIGRIESLGGNILSGFKRSPQKSWVNVEGGKVGYALRKVVEERKYLNHSVNPALLEKSSYLNLKEDFRDRLPIHVDPSLKADAILADAEKKETSQIVVRSQDTLSNCKAELILDLGGGYDSTDNKISLEHVTFEKGKDIYLPLSARFVQGVRGFLTDCAGSKKEAAFEIKGL